MMMIGHLISSQMARIMKAGMMPRMSNSAAVVSVSGYTNSVMPSAIVMMDVMTLAVASSILMIDCIWISSFID